MIIDIIINIDIILKNYMEYFVCYNHLVISDVIIVAVGIEIVMGTYF